MFSNHRGSRRLDVGVHPGTSMIIMAVHGRVLGHFLGGSGLWLKPGIGGPGGDFLRIVVDVNHRPRSRPRWPTVQ